MTVDERGEDVMSDEICRRCNAKQERRRGGRGAQLPDWVISSCILFSFICLQAFGLESHKWKIFE